MSQCQSEFVILTDHIVGTKKDNGNQMKNKRQIYLKIWIHIDAV